MLQCAFLTTMLHISSTVLSAFSKFGEFFSFKCFDFEFETEGVTSYYYDTFFTRRISSLLLVNYGVTLFTISVCLDLVVLLGYW